jgi:hypothetical protein
MLKRWTRVLVKKDAEITDVSSASQHEGFDASLGPSSSGDAIFIGQDLPFNNVYLEMQVANAAEASLSVDCWDGRQWVPAVDVLDGTISGGTLGKNGCVQFVPDNDSFWTCLPDPSRTSDVGFTNKIYELYWLRIQSNIALDAETSIKRISYLFCENYQIKEKWSDVDLYLTKWAAGKTDWLEQIREATELMIGELKARSMIIHPGQILRYDDVNLACVYRTLMIIFARLGPSFAGHLKTASENYDLLMDNKRWTLDKNKSGKVEHEELSSSVSQGVR